MHVPGIIAVDRKSLDQKKRSVNELLGASNILNRVFFVCIYIFLFLFYDCFVGRASRKSFDRVYFDDFNTWFRITTLDALIYRFATRRLMVTRTLFVTGSIGETARFRPKRIFFLLFVT